MDDDRNRRHSGRSAASARRGSLALSDEQRGRIYEGVMNPIPDAPVADVPAPELADALPSGVPLQDLPAGVIREIPLVQGHKFVKFDDRILVVDPASRLVVRDDPALQAGAIALLPLAATAVDSRGECELVHSALPEIGSMLVRSSGDRRWWQPCAATALSGVSSQDFPAGSVGGVFLWWVARESATRRAVPARGIDSDHPAERYALV